MWVVTRSTHIDAAGVMTGHLGIQFTEDKPVAQLPVQKIKVLEDKGVISRSLTSEEGPKVRRLALPAVLEKWKVGATKNIRKEKVPNADTEYMKSPRHVPRGRRKGSPEAENICYGLLHLQGI